MILSILKTCYIPDEKKQYVAKLVQCAYNHLSDKVRTTFNTNFLQTTGNFEKLNINLVHIYKTV